MKYHTVIDLFIAQFYVIVPFVVSSCNLPFLSRHHRLNKTQGGLQRLILSDITYTEVQPLIPTNWQFQFVSSHHSSSASPFSSLRCMKLQCSTRLVGRRAINLIVIWDVTRHWTELLAPSIELMRLHTLPGFASCQGSSFKWCKWSRPLIIPCLFRSPHTATDTCPALQSNGIWQRAKWYWFCCCSCCCSRAIPTCMVKTYWLLSTELKKIRKFNPVSRLVDNIEIQF